MARGPSVGLIIREREGEIEKAISDSGNHNLPEVELENIDGRAFVCARTCVCLCVRGRGAGGGGQNEREGWRRRKRIKDEGQQGGC